jgi:hypothetical protein
MIQTPDISSFNCKNEINHYGICENQKQQSNATLLTLLNGVAGSVLSLKEM